VLQRRLALWVRWLLADLLVPLLRAHFYCTETEAYRQQVFYYRSRPLSSTERLL
jgi:telomerase reverse transcriptase